MWKSSTVNYLPPSLIVISVQLSTKVRAVIKRASLMNSTLVKLLGFPSTLIHGDTLVLDRWLWLRRRLPSTKNQEKLIDIGCGSGAYTIGATLRGYQSLGLSWDETCQSLAKYRAKLCNAENAKFSIQDVRKLEFREDLKDSVRCCHML